ncbi:ATP-binding protein [Agathobaculum sp. Marseille-P7918]|uniref:ATP-binding protein n=1 Tax=Agathobaculum sp. Marseille-P7918 TaxID=2479843 RepID=UPI000F6399C6|nr:ATP-binding protein [Agathobaculum sp. Marseille-P7918]
MKDETTCMMRYLSQAKNDLTSLKNGFPPRSVLYYGAKSIGKIALLHQIELLAEQVGILHCYLDAATATDFTKQLVTQIALCFQNSGIAKTETKPDHIPGVDTADLTEDMVLYGQVAAQTKQGICLLIDEMQALRSEDLKGLTMALHRCNQLRLPVMLFGVGEPVLLKMLGKTCSYAERLFSFEKL